MAGEVFTSVKEEDVLHHAELLTLRQITKNLELIASEMLAHRKDMTAMQVDVAIIKERQTQSQELKEKITSLETKIDVLEKRNDSQDGAYTFVTLLKDFGPWAFGLLVLAWSLLGKPHN
jgi:acyl carrier protein phosphodiesterase